MSKMAYVMAAGLLLLSACGAGSSRSELVVSAAASLSDAFSAMAGSFEEQYPGVDVVLNLGGSSTLREQILEGAPVDVYASADLVNMEQLRSAGAVTEPAALFGSNLLEIAVPVGNPAGITDLEDFGRSELVLGLCAASVPCGVFAREALASAGVSPAVDTNEPDVRALLTKIEAGELDAGITYVTDVVAADGAVQGLVIDPSLNVAAHYPIAPLADAPNPDLAADFVDYVLSPSGQAIMAEFGFMSP